MAVNVAALRSQLETALAGRVPTPFAPRPAPLQTTPFPIAEVQALTHGLQRGGLTEICGPACSGSATLLLSVLASRTEQAEACALVDGRDTFDPHSAEAAGVKLERLLWVRCRQIDQCLRATDLLLQGGGFGLIALDLSLLPPKTVRYVPLNVWFRFRRAVENTSTILLLLDQESNAGTCASLVLRLGSEPALWLEPQARRASSPANFCACLLDGSHIHAEVIRSRLPADAGARLARRHSAGPATSFKTKTQWGYLQEIAAQTK